MEVRGDQVKVGIDAPKDVKVFRQEVFNAIQSENKAAAATAKADLSALSNLLKK